MRTSAVGCVVLGAVVACGCSPAGVQSFDAGAGDGGGSANVGNASSSGSSGGDDASRTDGPIADASIPDDRSSPDSSDASVEGGQVDDSGLPAAMPSAGCGKTPAQALQMFVQYPTTIGTTSRVYRVWLPAGYDPQRSYRTIFLGHGCGDNNGCAACGPAGTPFPGLEMVADGILVAMVAEGSCFDNGDGTPNSPELLYFDQILEEVSANFCVDQARVFVGGFSSGSWVSHLIGCARAGTGPGKVRAQVTATGEWPNPPPCTGPIASILAHDMNDPANPFSAGKVARDHILQTNHCNQQTVPYSFDGVTPATSSSGNCAITSTGCQPCVEYQGCMAGYPVIWCPTNGNNPAHSRQVPITTIGLWRFISQF